MIIGREKEISTLKNAVQDDYSHFIAIYGRRRIGKTFLVREAFGYRFTFQHAGLSSGGLKEQLFEFSSSIKNAGGETSGKAKNWLEAFEELKELIRKSKEERKIIFIDELSWMDTKNSDLIVALENFWNGWASARRDVILIVCTSATSWMLNKIIHNKGGLYNRLTERIKLEQFTLADCEKYIKAKGMSFNRNQILQFYMIFGGVPYYWSFLKKGLSLPQNVDEMLFAENAPLQDEFKYLYASIFRKPDVYLKIIKTLSLKKVGMTREEIIKNSGIANSGDLTKKLEELESCGFIRRYSSFGKKKKDSIYQLIDCFTLFYYQFMEKEPNDEHFWQNRINMPETNTWYGLAFERVVLCHIPEVKRRLGIEGVSTEVNAFYIAEDKENGIKGAQIDLLIVRKDQIINLCEMKYSGTEYRVTIKDDEGIRNKTDSLVKSTKTKYAIYPTLITTFGAVENSYFYNFQSLIVLDDLFRE